VMRKGYIRVFIALQKQGLRADQLASLHESDGNGRKIGGSLRGKLTCNSGDGHMQEADLAGWRVRWHGEEFFWAFS
jgi:hypothetical protein